MIKTHQESSPKCKIAIQLLTLFFLVFLTIYVIAVTSVAFNFFSNDTKKSLTYEELKESLFNGDKLRIVMHYKYMDFYFNYTKIDSPDEISGFDLEDYQYFARGVIFNPLEYIITSFATLTVHPTYGPIYDYGKVRLFEDGRFEIIVYFLDALDFRVVEYKTLNASLSSKAVYFYHQTPKLRKLF